MTHKQNPNAADPNAAGPTAADSTDWEAAWNDNHTPWDAGQSPPILQELVRTHALPTGKAIVPGCGAGYDVMTLAHANRTVWGVDLASSVAPRFEQVREQAQVPLDHVHLVQRDLFQWQPEQPFDLWWDYTFLCALPPRMRGPWASTTHRLIRPGGELVALLFPVVNKPRDQGPPFAIDPEEICKLLAPYHELQELTPVQHSIPSRQGKEVLARFQRLPNSEALPPSSTP